MWRPGGAERRFIDEVNEDKKLVGVREDTAYRIRSLHILSCVTASLYTNTQYFCFTLTIVAGLGLICFPLIRSSIGG